MDQSLKPGEPLLESGDEHAESEDSLTQVDLLQENPFEKYWREHRLLNSLLISLFLIMLAMVLVWNIIVWVEPAGEPVADFSDAGREPDRKKMKEQKVKLMQRQKSAKPTQAFKFQAKAISDIPAPVADIKITDINPAVLVSPMGDVGDVSVNVDMSALTAAFTSSFMGVKSQARKVAFIIDYSASMKGKDRVMRHELDAAVKKLPPTGEVCLIFFSGPSWLAGENARNIHKNWSGDNSKGWHPKSGFVPKSPKWIPVTPAKQKELSEHIWNTPLTLGSVWDNSYRWALTKLSPKPDVIYFMTDGAAKIKGMEIIKRSRGRTKIYTIAYGTPPAAKAPLMEIAKMTGGKFKYVSNEQIKEMEKKIKR